MKNILLLTDFSDNSKNAIDYALQLFEDVWCNFYILYVQDATAYTSDNLITNSATSVYDSLIGKHRQKLVKYAKSLESKFGNEHFNIHTIVDFDSLIDAINQTILSKKIDLIVMGTNGATGAKEVIFGSNTINVIRKVTCNTLIIPESYTYVDPKKMLLALDPFDKLDGVTVLDFFKFFEHHDIKLHVLRINPNRDTNEIEKEDKAHLSHFVKSGNFVYSLIDDIPMEHAVNMYTQNNKIDIISLFVQEESLIERLFIGSPTTKINKEAKFPLLIFHPIKN